MGPIRIGAPEYVSVRPLVYGLLREPAARVDFGYRSPAVLAEMLERERLDAALIPSIEYLRGVGRRVVEGPALVARPGRGTVLLVTHKPLDSLASVAVTECCRSPVAVLRVVLAEAQGVTPDFLVEKNPSAWQERYDAVLLTGDAALDRLAQPGADGGTVHDIVDMWHALTGKPLVLGTWAYNDPDLAEPLSALLTLSRNLGVQHLSRLADGIARTSAFSAEFLYDSLSRRWSYALGEDEMQGLRALEELALKYDLVRDARLEPVAST